MAGLSRLAFVNVLYSFISAALAVMVPLYLIEKEISITSIGIILSLSPITFMLLRIFFASIADGIGTKTIAFLYSLSNAIAVIIYYFTTSSTGFLAGTFMEGMRNSGFWAISRTEVVFQNGKKFAGDALVHFSGIRQLADGLGRLSIGFVIAAVAFQNAFLIMLALSLLLLFTILSMSGWKLGDFHMDRRTVSRILGNRSRGFWANALGLTSISIASNMLLAFILPLYSRSALGLSFEETGTIIALFSLLSGIVMMVLLRKKAGRNAMLLLTALMVPVLLAIPLSPEWVLLLVGLLALGNGAGNLLAEYILAGAVAGSEDISTDIGLIYVPLRLSEFLFFFLGGFVIASWGYLPLFAVCALCVAFFLVFALKR